MQPFLAVAHENPPYSLIAYCTTSAGIGGHFEMSKIYWKVLYQENLKFSGSEYKMDDQTFTNCILI